MFEVRVAAPEALARAQGLDVFPTVFEVMPQDIMTTGYWLCPGPPY